MSGAYKRKRHTSSPESSGEEPGATRVRLLSGAIRLINLKDMPPDDFKIVETGVVGEAGSIPTIFFTNKCRPVFCIAAPGTPDGRTCYFKGDAILAVTLQGDCELGDPANAKSWFLEFLEACTDPLARLLRGYSTRKRTDIMVKTVSRSGLYLDLSLEEDVRTSLYFYDNKRLQFTISKFLTQGPWTDYQPEIEWEGLAPSPEMVQATQVMLKNPQHMTLLVSKMYPTEDWSTTRIEATLQLQVPKYAH
jgi:hypothetical protein